MTYNKKKLRWGYPVVFWIMTHIRTLNHVSFTFYLEKCYTLCFKAAINKHFAIQYDGDDSSRDPDRL